MWKLFVSSWISICFTFVKLSLYVCQTYKLNFTELQWVLSENALRLKLIVIFQILSKIIIIKRFLIHRPVKHSEKSSSSPIKVHEFTTRINKKEPDLSHWQVLWMETRTWTPYSAWPKQWRTKKSTWHLTSPRHPFSTPPFAWLPTTPRAPSFITEPSGRCFCQPRFLSGWRTSGAHIGPSGCFGYWTTRSHSLDRTPTKFAMPIPIWRTLKKRGACTRRRKRLSIFSLGGTVKEASSLNVWWTWVSRWLSASSGTRTRFLKLDTGSVILKRVVTLSLKWSTQH